MLFCSPEPLIESCSSQEDNVLFPQTSQNELFLLKNCIIVPKDTLSWNQTTLPPAGTPLSIFEFAGLSPVQQKQWLEACSDTKQNTTTQRNKATSATMVLPLSRNDVSTTSCEQQESCKTDDTDSITSLSSNRSDAQCPNGVQKRSIFAPYWAKTGERTGEEKNIHDPDVVSCAAPAPGNNNRITVAQILEEASQISMIPPPHHHLSTTSCTRSTNMIGRGCCWGDQHIPRPAAPRLLHQQEQDEARIATLSEQPPMLTPQRRVVSTSAISILKNKQGDKNQQEQGEGRRRRSSSFSVSFDSKVNVVLVFQDKPPYHTRRIPPWWARWLPGTGTGEFDVKEVIEKLAAVVP